MKKFFLILLAVVGISVAANAQVGYNQSNQSQKNEKSGEKCHTSTKTIGASIYGNGISETKTTKTCGDTKTVTTEKCATGGYSGTTFGIKVEATQKDCESDTKTYKKVKTEGGTRERWVETE